MGAPVPAAERRAPAGRRAVSTVALLTLTGVAAAAVWLPPPGSWTGFHESLGSAIPSATASATAVPSTATTEAPSASTGSPSPVRLPDAPPEDRPTPGGATTRLGTPPPAPVGGGPHAFVGFQDNGVTPIAYDPCRPVHYVIRPDQQPSGGEEMVHAAVARLSEATGLQFVHDGPSDEALGEDREPYQPERYGDRWAPVLVGWQSETENPALAGDVVGRAGSAALSSAGSPRVYVTGSVVLDAGQFEEILGWRSGQEVAQAVVLHEFAHVVGLAHVDDPSQLMNPETVPGITDFAAGDLAGLARLGRGVCAPHL
jgi:Matrixin